MGLKIREGRPADFDAWLAMEFPSFEDDKDWLISVAKEWVTLFKSGVLLTLAIEDTDKPPTKRMVAFGGGVFITDEYVKWLKTGATPYARWHAVNEMLDGSSQLLKKEDIGNANAGNGLNLLICYWRWGSNQLTPLEALNARTWLTEQFTWFHSGYNYKEVFVDGLGNDHLRRSQEAGFYLIADYAEYYAKNPPAPEPQYHPYILGIDREQAQEKDGSAICHTFLFTPPRFFFSEREREFLCHARLGKNDADLMNDLFLSLGMVKKRWVQIYEHIDKIDKSVLPQSTGNQRGQECKRVLLEYLRHHPEELRPYEPIDKKPKKS